MIARAVAVWLGILVLASANGALRDLVLTPRLGDTTARAVSSLVLAGVVVGVARLAIGWIAPPSAAAALGVGALWVALTLAFEFGAGHWLFRKPWAVLLEDYDVRRGRIWILVLVATFLAPWWAARARGPG